ncbi:uncharacterized protein LOC144705776 [Wolffia australiana]
MGVLGESSCCFCPGGGRSERVKTGILSGKGAAMAAVSGDGTGFLIHRNLLLTTHATLPSSAAAEAADVKINCGRVSARLVPHRFFITSTILDLTIVGVDLTHGDSNPLPPHCLKAASIPRLELGSLVFLLGYDDKNELMVTEAKVAVATDSLIKLSTGSSLSPGSAGFDFQGNVAFMVCDPMKLSSSPKPRSSFPSSSSSSSAKDLPTQFGIPIPIILDWLYQHWEGSLEELSKPKLTLLRRRSTAQKSDPSAVSFTRRRIFKEFPEEEDSVTSRPAAQLRSTEGALSCLRPPVDQSIPLTEFYESAQVMSMPVPRKSHQSPLLDINFPPRNAKPAMHVLPERQKSTTCSEKSSEVIQPCAAEEDCCSEVHSSSSPLGIYASPGDGDDFNGSSDGETMYSAETMESRNYSSPRQVARTQSCMNYQRWSCGAQTSAAVARRRSDGGAAERVPAHSQAQTMPVNHKGHIYDSPTVSSAMKMRGDRAEQRSRPRRMVAQVSPRWMF